ncbi:MAG: endonuclease domain-containing protein [Proteobacteria bacterium]|nr:endonuclease domain-containing protein [Pseudomonadota bacterium]MBI3498749.1 endonuclease domain-containing protein [Pseudomonadota bacterium]
MSISAARKLRRNMTEAESRLWTALRHHQLDGFKFRRQHAIGPYVLDFYCEPLKLVVEVDGGQHNDAIAHDAARTAWLEARGCRVLRFWNNEDLGNLSGVLATIQSALPASPHPLARARDLSPRER